MSECEKKSIWNNVKESITKNGLEEGLKSINLGNQAEKEFVDDVRNITARYLLNEELKCTNEFYVDTGFSKLTMYLSNSASTNAPILDIMTNH